MAITITISQNNTPVYCTTEGGYVLPVATETTLGGVLSGGDITIDANGNVHIADSVKQDIETQAKPTADNVAIESLENIPAENLQDALDELDEIITRVDGQLSVVKSTVKLVESFGGVLEIHYSELVPAGIDGRPSYPDKGAMVFDELGNIGFISTIDADAEVATVITVLARTDVSGKADKAYTDATFETKADAQASHEQLHTAIESQGSELDTKITANATTITSLKKDKADKSYTDETFQTKADAESATQDLQQQINQNAGEIAELDADKQAKLTAGNGVSIAGNTIAVASTVIQNTATGKNSIALGDGATATGNNAVAIGMGAYVSENGGIQIGFGSNSDGGFNVSLGTNGQENVQVLSVDGTLPPERIASLPADNGSYTPVLTIQDGKATLAWVSVA